MPAMWEPVLQQARRKDVKTSMENASVSATMLNYNNPAEGQTNNSMLGSVLVCSSYCLVWGQSH